MSLTAINATLGALNSSSPQILVSIVVSPDGFTIAHQGNVEQPDSVGALYVELKLLCENILKELGQPEVEEIFIRSRTKCVFVLPIQDKGVLACMSEPNVNSVKMQMLTMKAARRLGGLL